MSTPLTRFETALQQALAQGFSQRPEFSPPKTVIKAADDVKAFFNAGPVGQPPVDRKRQALRTFVQQHRIDSVQQAYLIAWGLGDAQVDATPLIERQKEFQEFLEIVKEMESTSSLPSPVWRGLLASYFSYNVLERESQIGSEAWHLLRAFLDESFERTWARRSVHPEWMNVLHANRNLFEDHAADVYAEDLVAGRLDGIRYLTKALVIPQRSWFVGSLVMAQVRHAAALTDSNFKSHIPAICSLVREHRLYASRALKRLLKRYFDCDDASENVELRDLALETWGSPKLPSNDGKWSTVDTDIKGMVLKWLLGRDLVEFFEILAADGRSDKRRLDFWMRYVDEMRDAYFALGTAALESQDSDHRALIKRNQGRVAKLRGAGRDANAFVMLFSKYVIVEFGVKGNRCFCYARDQLPFDLDDESFQGGYGGLKQRVCVFALRHADTSWGKWEDELERELGKLGLHATAEGKPPRRRESVRTPHRVNEPAVDYGFTDGHDVGGSVQPVRAEPQQPQVPDDRLRRRNRWKHILDGLSSGDMFDDTQLALWAQRNGFPIEDNRHRDGALKIYTNDRNLEVNALLLKLGFRYNSGKSFWWKS